MSPWERTTIGLPKKIATEGLHSVQGFRFKSAFWIIWLKDADIFIILENIEVSKCK